MKKIFLLSVIICSLSAINADAATSYDVQEFNRESQLGLDAISSKNYEKAFKHLDKAAKLGNKMAQFSLALLYIEGFGVEKDYTKAYLWLNVAAEAKEKKWREMRDKVHNVLTVEQQIALEPRVSKYIEKYGAETQEVSCYRRKITGSNRKLMSCSKLLDR